MITLTPFLTAALLAAALVLLTNPPTVRAAGRRLHTLWARLADGCADAAWVVADYAAWFYATCRSILRHLHRPRLAYVLLLTALWLGPWNAQAHARAAALDRVVVALRNHYE